MENQNIQWVNWAEQPQENNDQQQGWGEQPPWEQSQQPNWEQQSQESNNQPTLNWEGVSQNSNTQTLNSGWGEIVEEEDKSNKINNLPTEDWVKKSSCLGLVTRMDINVLLYKLNYNNNLAIQELTQSGFEPVDDDGKFKTKFEGNPEITNILTAIRSIGKERGLKLDHTFIYKNSPKESSINITRGESFYNFVYFLQADYDSGKVLLDFSSLKGGPTFEAIESSTGILSLTPGWVPYSISKNNSDKDMIAIAGRFIPDDV